MLQVVEESKQVGGSQGSNVAPVVVHENYYRLTPQREAAHQQVVRGCITHDPTGTVKVDNPGQRPLRTSRLDDAHLGFTGQTDCQGAVLPSPRPASRPRKLADLACFAIYTAGHAFHRAYKLLLDALRLTYPQDVVMVVLWEDDGQTVGQLGQRLCLESSHLGPLLKRLEGAGQVCRERDPADERQVRVRLTPAGKTPRVKARKVPPRILRASGRSAESLTTPGYPGTESTLATGPERNLLEAAPTNFSR